MILCIFTALDGGYCSKSAADDTARKAVFLKVKAAKEEGRRAAGYF